MQASEGKNRFFGNLWATKLKGARRMTPWRTAKIRCTTLGHLDRQFGTPRPAIHSNWINRRGSNVPKRAIRLQ